MTNFKNQRALIISPHPDDEVVGCGGIIQKIKEGHGKVYILFLTNGDTKDFSKKGLSTGLEREKEIEQVAKFLKYDGYHIAFPGNNYHLKLDQVGQLEIMNMIERKSRVSIEKIKPNIIMFPSASSYNQDHRVAAMATHASARTSSREKHFIPTVLSYEQAADFWSLDAQVKTNWYVPLAEQELQKKIEALRLYKSQWREFPSSRSEETLTAFAKLRGSECTSNFAEGFFVHRIIL